MKKKWYGHHGDFLWLITYSQMRSSLHTITITITFGQKLTGNGKMEDRRKKEE